MRRAHEERGNTPATPGTDSALHPRFVEKRSQGPASGTRPRRPVVLLAEDVEELRSTLALILTREGFSVVQAADGREAVDRARRVLPDVILMDLSLPVLDGATAIRVLASYEPTRKIPVVALSGMSVSASEARSLGLADVVRKPCTPHDLVARLRAVLGPNRAMRGVR